MAKSQSGNPWADKLQSALAEVDALRKQMGKLDGHLVELLAELKKQQASEPRATSQQTKDRRQPPQEDFAAR